MFIFVEQALPKMVRYGRSFTISASKMGSGVQKEAVAEIIVQSVLLNTGLIVLIPESLGKVVDRAVDEYSLWDMEKPSTTVVSD